MELVEEVKTLMDIGVQNRTEIEHRRLMDIHNGLGLTPRAKYSKCGSCLQRALNNLNGWIESQNNLLNKTEE